MVGKPVPDLGFPGGGGVGGGRQHPCRGLLFVIIFPETAWKWQKLYWEGARVDCTPCSATETHNKHYVYWNQALIHELLCKSVIQLFLITINTKLM